MAYYLTASFTAFLLSLNWFLKSYFQTIPKILPQSPSSYCPNSDPCIRPDLLAFQATCAVPILITALYGTKSYFALKRKEDTTLEERVYGYSLPSIYLVSVNLAFQIFDILASLNLPEHFLPIPMFHHILASLVLNLCLRHQTLSYYAPFYAGVTEVSTVPLVFVDIDKYFVITDPTLKGVAEISKAMFAVSFFGIRVGMWWGIWTPRLIKDVRDTRNGSKVKDLRKGKGYVLVIFVVVNVALGAMQVFWAGKIISAVMDAVAEGEL
ncbi:hypothetical protein TrCOL_g11500 [Triparma columacea]|uniref:TLC domain-containing protein n=1 Tax=Triparma columacea TaxID=722753 RepID=A0A9W7L8W0_9STRA|nr:hypothetical protein TrCOL_g11500 [Triparma columacea]